MSIKNFNKFKLQNNILKKGNCNKRWCIYDGWLVCFVWLTNFFHRTNVTVQNTSTTPQGSIQITLQAPRPSGEGSSKQASIPRTIDVQKPLLHALRTTTVDSVPKTTINTQARPLAEASVKSVIAGTLQRSLETKQAGRQPIEPVIRPPKTIHVPQTSAFSGTKVIVTQASNSSVNPHNLVTNPMKTNKGFNLSVLLLLIKWIGYRENCNLCNFHIACLIIHAWWHYLNIIFKEEY